MNKLNQEAIEDWIAYRKEIKKPLKPMSIKGVTKKLLKHPYEVQEAMVEQSITNGWQGLFEVKNATQKPVEKCTRTADFIDMQFNSDWASDL